MRETPTQVPGLQEYKPQHSALNIYKVPVVMMGDLVRRSVLLVADLIMIALTCTVALAPITLDYFFPRFGIGHKPYRKTFKAWLWSEATSPWYWTKRYWKSVLDRATDKE